MYNEVMRVFLNKRTALAALLGMLLLIQGCARLKQINVVSCKVESVSMRGLRGVSAVLSVGVDNPAAAFGISDMEGTVYVGNDVLGSFSADEFQVAGRCVSENNVPVDFTLDRSVSFMEILSLLRNMDLDMVTMDISFRAKVKGGVSKKMRFERLPASRLISGADVMEGLDGIRNFLVL